MNEERMSTTYEDSLSIILIGDPSVGKTSLMKRYKKTTNCRFIDNTFSENLLNTLGVELFQKVVNINGIFYQIKILDTCGQERLRALTANYYRNADGIMLLFDLTQISTFNNLQNWIESVQEKVQDQLPLVIVGNKTDLIEHQVTTDMIKNLSKKYEVEIFKTSAKNGDESGKPFIRLAEEIIENKKTRRSIFVMKKEEEKKRKCCGKSE